MSLLAPDDSGRVFRGLSLWEAFVTVYFLGALLLVLLLPIRILRGLCCCLDELLFGSSAEAQKEWPRRRAFLRKVLPALLLIPMAIPYLGGVMYVHRLKMPNLATPLELLGREYEDVAFTTDDGLTLRGWFIPASSPAPRTLLICHGLGINRSHVLSYVAAADALGAHVFLFDFRGHGESDGHTVSIGYREKLDVRAAVRYLRQQRPAEAGTIIGLGLSMGSAALIRAAAELDEPLSGLILDSGFAGVAELTDNVLAIFPAPLRPLIAAPGLLLASLHAGCDLSAVRPVEQIGHVHAPVLFIHAREDRLIPVEHAARLFAAAIEPKSVWIAETGDHCSAWNARDDYILRLDQLPIR
jgi:alpha-beta hydrolase superfamily lysophospholipase